MTAVAVENLPMVTDYHSAKEFDYGRRRDGEKGSLVTGRYLPFFVSYNHRPFFVSYNHRHGNTVKNTNTIARFGIKYYDTEVVSFHPMGQIEINCGEWPTTNTARIINHYLPEGWRANYRFNYVKRQPNGAWYGYRQKENERIEIRYNGKLMTTLYGDYSARDWNYDNEGAEQRFSFAVINTTHDEIL